MTRIPVVPHREGLPTEETISAVVRSFYDKVRGDELLAPVFAARIDGHWEEHLSTMVDFWSSILLTSGRYRGRPLAVHDQIAEITPAMANRWLALFAETARAECPPEMAEMFVQRSQQIAEHLFRRLGDDRGGANDADRERPPALASPPPA